MNKIERAHQMYRDGKYEEALEFYTEALSIAKTNPQKIALHSNRAACYLKLHHFKKAADECTSVLELDYEHTGALMLRAQTLVTLKEYQSALFDVNRLIELNPSSEVYQNLEARLKTQLSLAPIPEAETELEEEEEDEDSEKENEDGEEEDNKDEQSYSLGLAGNHSHDSNAPASKDDVSNRTSVKITITAPQTQSPKEEIAKPKGHSRLDYSRWDKVEDDSSEDDDDDDEDSQPQYRFRVKNIGVRVWGFLIKRGCDGGGQVELVVLRLPDFCHRCSQAHLFFVGAQIAKKGAVTDFREKDALPFSIIGLRHRRRAYAHGCCPCSVYRALGGDGLAAIVHSCPYSVF